MNNGAEIINVYVSALGESAFIKMPHGWIVVLHTFYDNVTRVQFFNTYSAAADYEHEQIHNHLT